MCCDCLTPEMRLRPGDMFVVAPQTHIFKNVIAAITIVIDLITMCLYGLLKCQCKCLWRPCLPIKCTVTSMHLINRDGTKWLQHICQRHIYSSTKFNLYLLIHLIPAVFSSCFSLLHISIFVLLHTNIFVFQYLCVAYIHVIVIFSALQAAGVLCDTLQTPLFSPSIGMSPLSTVHALIKTI